MDFYDNIGLEYVLSTASWMNTKKYTYENDTVFGVDRIYGYGEWMGVCCLDYFWNSIVYLLVRIRMHPF